MTTSEYPRYQSTARYHSTARYRRGLENIFWYIVLIAIAVVTIFPFVWVFSTSFKGPNDAIYLIQIIRTT